MDICHHCGQEILPPTHHRRDIDFVQASSKEDKAFFKVRITLHFHHTCYSAWFQRQDLTLLT